MSFCCLVFCLWVRRSWLLCQQGSQCFWFTWPQSQSPELASTQLGVSELQSSTTEITLGMTTYESTLITYLPFSSNFFLLFFFFLMCDERLRFNLSTLLFCFVFLGAVDLLGWTVHRSCSCCYVPPDCDQSYSFQVQGLIQSLNPCFINFLSLCFVPFFFHVHLVVLGSVKIS